MLVELKSQQYSFIKLTNCKELLVAKFFYALTHSIGKIEKKKNFNDAGKKWSLTRRKNTS